MQQPVAQITGGIPMDKMRMESVNMTEKNIEIIEQFFPNCITERTNVRGVLQSGKL